MKKEIYSLEIWYINNKYYLRAYSVTIVGLRDAGNNSIHVIDSSNKEALGVEILETLKECKQGVPHPDYRREDKNEMLAITGMKTEKKIMREGLKLSVIMKEDYLKITPMYFDGQAMSPSIDRYLTCSFNPPEITKAVLKAFELCHP